MDLLQLMAFIGLDKTEYDEGLLGAEKDAKSAGSKIGSAFKALGVAVGAAITTAATGIGFLVKNSVDGYAEYEQLVGGVQKLYGNMGQSLEEYAKNTGKTTDEVAGEWQKLEDAQNTVLNNAKNAYKTAGMDMNTYMENATSFSASLINSLGGDTQAAADMTDVAMRSISDNFNTFGGDLESITNAYKGFSKENYTMLDNLKLGYGGTKEEMERLIADANEWGAANGKASDLSIDSFADVVTAIEQIQKKQNIAETTAREATTTIAGSLGMLSSAWKNLVTGFSDSEADIDQLINNVITSLVGTTDEAGVHINGFIDNIVPTIITALGSIGTAIGQLAPIISEQLPVLADQLLPGLLESAVSLVTALAGTLPSILSTLIEAIVQQGPAIVDAALQIALQLVQALPGIINLISSNLPTLISEIAQVVVDNAPAFLAAGLALITALGDAILSGVNLLDQDMTEDIDSVINKITEKLPEFLAKGLEIVGKIAVGLINALPNIVQNMYTIIEGLFSLIVQNLPAFIEQGFQIILKLAQGLVNALPDIIQALGNLIAEMITTIVQNLPQFIESGMKIIAQLIVGIGQMLPSILEAIGNLAIAIIQIIISTNWISIGKKILEGIKNGFVSMTKVFLNAVLNLIKTAVTNFKNKIADFKDAGKNIVTGIIAGVTAMGAKFVSAITDLAKKALQGIKDFFGIHSPSRVMEQQVGKQLVLGMAAGINKNESEAEKAMEEMGSKILSQAQKTLDNYKALNDMSLEAEMEYWGSVIDMTQEGTQARIDAQKKYLEAEEKYSKANGQLRDDTEKANREYLTNYVKAYDDAQKEIAKIDEELSKEIDKLNQEYEKSVQSRVNSIMGMTGLFDRVKYDEGKSKDELVGALQDQVTSLKSWDSELDKLAERIGQDNALMETIQEMGVKSLDTIKSLNTMSDEELKTYTELYDEKEDLARKRAVKENKQLRDNIDEQIKILQKGAEDQRKQVLSDLQTTMQKLKEDLVTKMNEIAEQGKQSGSLVGTMMGEGMAKGLESERNIITDTARSVARAAYEAAMAELDIHSPSKKFAFLGRMTDKGFVEGLKDGAKEIEATIHETFGVDDFANNLRTATSGRLANVGSRGYNQVINITSLEPLSPWEVARQTRNATKNMVLAMG